MKVLGIDTATGIASVAILDDDRVLAETHSDTAGHRADLLVLVDAVCTGAGISPRELDGVAIGAGPGSFTGLRIGMATAKGIAFAAGRPLWAVSSLAALAADAVEELADPQLVVHAGGAICAALDARRGELFAGCYRGGAALGPERVMPPGELAAWVAELAGAEAGTAPPVLSFAGDAIDAHPSLAALASAHPWLAARTPSGRAVARLALAGARVDITLGGAPTYIRPSEAEVKYPDGVPGALRRRDT